YGLDLLQPRELLSTVGGAHAVCSLVLCDSRLTTPSGGRSTIGPPPTYETASARPSARLGNCGSLSVPSHSDRQALGVRVASRTGVFTLHLRGASRDELPPRVTDG